MCILVCELAKPWMAKLCTPLSCLATFLLLLLAFLAWATQGRGRVGTTTWAVHAKSLKLQYSDCHWGGLWPTANWLQTASSDSVAPVMTDWLTELPDHQRDWSTTMLTDHWLKPYWLPFSSISIMSLRARTIGEFSTYVFTINAYHKDKYL